MRITKLITLKPEDLFNVFKYIEKFAEEGQDKREYALANIGRFFVNITLQQQIELFSLIEQEDYFGLEKYIKENPAIEVNLDGDTKLRDPDGWEIKAETLDKTYNMAKNPLVKKSPAVTQMINARELNCLKNVKLYPLSFEKKKMKEEYGNVALLEKLDDYVNSLKDIFDVNKFMSLVLEYTRKGNKNIFLKYVLYYLDVIKLDIERQSALTNEYINTINNILLSFKK